MTATFDTSYAALSEPAARLYRHAGQHPGVFDAPAAAALADLEQHEAEAALTELLTAHLIEAPAPDRYRLHDLARDHAQATSRDVDPEPERHLAVERMLQHYLIHAAAADLMLNPHRFRVALAVFDAAAHARPYADREVALGWMQTELDNLAALVRLAHHSGRHATCWRLCETLKMTLTLTKHYDIWGTTCELGLASAAHLGDPEAEAFMHFMVGSHRLQAHRDTEAAMDHYHKALLLWRGVGHRQGVASAYEGIGSVALAAGNIDEALYALLRSLDIHLELGRDRGAAIQHRHLGDIHRAAGNHAASVAHYEQALAHFRAIDDAYMTVRTLVGVATTHLATGEIEQARDLATHARDLAEAITARHEIANAAWLLAQAAHAAGDPTTELTHLTHAHELFTRLASPNAETVGRRLDELEAIGH